MIEREKALKILKMGLVFEMKRNKSEVYQRAEKIYKSMKDLTMESFSQIGTNEQVVLMFFFFLKFDKMLIELYLSIKIIIHITIMTYLSPKFQSSAVEPGEKILVSGNSMVTFFKKYKLLADTLHSTLPPRLVDICEPKLNYLFDESIYLISTMVEENLFEIMKYSPESAKSISPLLSNLQANLKTLAVV